MNLTRTIAYTTQGTRWTSSRPECKKSIHSQTSDTVLNLPRQLQTSAAVGNDRYNGMVDCFRKIIKHEGYTSLPHTLTTTELTPSSASRLYRGISAPILMEAPKRYLPLPHHTPMY